jgi:hypothetical protein
MVALMVPWHGGGGTAARHGHYGGVVQWMANDSARRHPGRGALLTGLTLTHVARSG